MGQASLSLSLTRRLPASPAEVFDAWLDPDSLREWMSPGEATVAEVEVDARPGGRFRIVMLGAWGRLEHTGEYVELARPHRLIFTWCSDLTEGEETLVTLDLEARGEETDLTLTHERLPSVTARQRHGQGWASIALKLETYLREGHGL